MDRDYPIYIIYSSWSIDKITTFLKSYDPDGVSMLKIVYDNSSQETNKTIAILSDRLYQLLVDHNYHIYRFEIDFKVKKYKLGDYLLPPADKSTNLFVPIIKKTTEVYVTQKLNDKLVDLANFGIIEHDAWKLKCPISSRGDGQVILGCFIFFKKEIDTFNIGVVRFLLNNTTWEANGNHNYDNMLKCHWAKHKNK
jgi:hypothetical protein